jgi:hypothetical protein
MKRNDCCNKQLGNKGTIKNTMLLQQAKRYFKGINNKPQACQDGTR